MDILNRHHRGRKKSKNKKKASPASKRSSALFKQQSATAPGGSTPAPSAPGGSGLFDYNSSATLELDAEAFYDIPIDSNLLDEWFLPDPEETADPASEKTALLSAPGRATGSAAAPRRALASSPAQTYQIPAKEKKPRTSSCSDSSPSAFPDEAGHTTIYFSPLIHTESAGKEHIPGPELTTRSRTSADPDNISGSHRDRAPDRTVGKITSYQTAGMRRAADTGKAPDTHRSTDTGTAPDTHRSTDTGQPGRTGHPASEAEETGSVPSHQQKPAISPSQDPAAAPTAPTRPKAPAQPVSSPHPLNPGRMAQAARSGPENLLDLIVTIAGIALCIFAVLYFHIRLAGREPLTGTGTGAIQCPCYESVICDSGAPEHDETVSNDPGASAPGQTALL